MPITLKYDPSNAEKAFSGLQEVTDAVQSEDTGAPGCCLRTTFSLSGTANGRHYRLEIPTKGFQPNETVTIPAHIRQHLIQPIVSPVWQMLSHADPQQASSLVISAEGPSECPPGSANVVKIGGVSTEKMALPFPAWEWKAPALLNPELLLADEPSVIKMLHPTLLPTLPAQTWTVSIPGCSFARSSRLATVQSFPDVRWSGTLALYSAPSSERKGYHINLSGDLTVSYGTTQRRLSSWDDAVALSPWIQHLEPLAKSVASVMALKPSDYYKGLDHHRLACFGEMEVSPWPQAQVQVVSQLFEQVDHGLIGHAVAISLRGDPAMGLRGEISLLAPRLDSPSWRPFLQPILAGRSDHRPESVCCECGFFLTAQGSLAWAGSLQAQRPNTATETRAQSRGSLETWLEGRSVLGFESFMVVHGSAEDSAQAARFALSLTAGPPSALADPNDRLLNAGGGYSGLKLSEFQQWRPGIRVLAKVEKRDDAPPPSQTLLPSRLWPNGTGLGETSEIPWCKK